MYVPLPLTVDVAPFVAGLGAVDLAPGSGGSRITWVGEITVGPYRGRGGYVALYPSAQLVAHRDPPILGVRLHVPLIVNHGCWTFHGGMWQQLAVGRAYQMDPTIEHGAVNWGSERRVHLMLDVEGEWQPTG